MAQVVDVVLSHLFAVVRSLANLNKLLHTYRSELHVPAPSTVLDPTECPLTRFYLFINFNFAKILQVRATPAPASDPTAETKLP